LLGSALFLWLLQNLNVYAGVKLPYSIVVQINPQLYVWGLLDTKTTILSLGGRLTGNAWATKTVHLVTFQLILQTLRIDGAYYLLFSKPLKTNVLQKNLANLFLKKNIDKIALFDR